jgi:methylated-DNA-[protein]-cysteine S-methyltransferase
VDYRYLDTPVGRLLLAREGRDLRLLNFQRDRSPAPDPRWHESPDAFEDVLSQLTEYFAGRRQRFELHLAPEGTPFQQRVWRELQDIPYGVTMSYGQIATRIGRPTASRAVGLANGSNPIAIVIPCHRVIGANGTLTGYGGGLPIKERLLALERGERRLIE